MAREDKGNVITTRTLPSRVAVGALNQPSIPARSWSGLFTMNSSVQAAPRK